MFLSHHFSSVARLRAGLGGGGGLPTPTYAWNLNGGGTDELASNNLTVNGATLTSGAIGWGYNLDGSNDYLETSSSWVCDPTNLSISFILNAETAFTTGQWIMRHGDFSTTLARAFSIGSNGSSFRVEIYDSSGAQEGLVDFNWMPTLNTDHHIVITIDASVTTATDAIKLFVDGTKITSTNSTVDLGGDDINNSSYTTDIGRMRSTLTRYLDGTLSNIFVWNGTTLSESEAVDIYNSSIPMIYTATNGWIDNTSLEYGARGYWKLNEASGDVTDYVLQDTATAQGSGLSYSQTGIIGNAISSDGTLDTGFDTGRRYIVSGSDFSANVWFKLTDTGANNVILPSIDSASAGDYFIWRVRPSSGDIRLDRSGGTPIAYSWTPDTDWHMATLVHDASGNVTMYLDGSLIGTTAARTFVDADFVLFCTDFASWGTEGILDEMFIRKGLLSTAQISTLYASGSPGTGQQYPF